MFNAPGLVIAAAATVAGALVLLVWGLAGVDRARHAAGSERLGTRHGAPVDQSVHRLVNESAFTRILKPIGRAARERARKITPGGWIEALERRVNLAGAPQGWPVERVMGVKVILALVFALGAAGVVLARWGTGSGLNVIVALIGGTAAAGLVGYLIPDAVLAGRARERQMDIQLALPDTLDQMTISVEAGLGFDAAIRRVSNTGTGPLAEELRRVVNEVALGVPRRTAFHHLADRSDIRELRNFIFAITQAEEYGIPIADVLRTQARELRIIRRQRAEERAMKIPVKLTLPLVVCILPALFIVLLVPAAIRIMDGLF